MGQMNRQTPQIMHEMQEFGRAVELSNAKEEMLNDALMDAFDGDGVEEEVDEVVSTVLQELALDTAHRVRLVKSP